MRLQQLLCKQFHLFKVFAPKTARVLFLLSCWLDTPGGSDQDAPLMDRSSSYKQS